MRGSKPLLYLSVCIYIYICAVQLFYILDQTFVLLEHYL